MEKKYRRGRANSANSGLQVKNEFEPDPMLRLSEGKATSFQMVIVGLAAIAIIGAVAWAIR
jgi:hypothetical protein